MKYQDLTPTEQEETEEEYGDEFRPQFILHVGPEKTATTTLQHELSRYGRYLSDDNVLYVGKNVKKLRGTPIARGLIRWFRECPDVMEKARREHKDIRTVSCWQDAQNFFEDCRRNGTSIVISDEEFSKEYVAKKVLHLPSFHETFVQELDAFWDVTVIGTYRRYAEWLLSAERQDEKVYCLYRHVSRGLLWPRPMGNGIECQTVYAKVQQYMRNGMGFHFLYSSDAIQMHAKQLHAKRTYIMNFHDPYSKSIVENFVCHAIIGADRSCQTIRTLEQSRTNAETKNVLSGSTESIFDRLVVAAPRKGILTDIRQRQRGSFVQELLKLKLRREDILEQLPLICPSQQWLDMLLSKSLSLEESVLPQFFQSKDGEEAHRDSFQKLVDSKAFCNVDNDAVLQNVTA